MKWSAHRLHVSLCGVVCESRVGPVAKLRFTSQTSQANSCKSSENRVSHPVEAWMDREKADEDRRCRCRKQVSQGHRRRARVVARARVRVRERMHDGGVSLRAACRCELPVLCILAPQRLEELIIDAPFNLREAGIRLGRRSFVTDALY